ncbi:MAG: c-type cytochrome [Anaerolineales bacterium]|nr:c-type cytochrome [Anaerolineales bacterium]
MFDFVGVLVLIVLAAVFGFLATRAWRLKNGLLRWGATALGGLLTLAPLALLALALVGFYKLNQHYRNPVADVQVAGTAAQIARGEQLAHVCAGCHSPDGGPVLSGVNFLAKFPFPPVGTFYAPNLTPSGDIQDWTDGEVIRAIREGVHQDGRALLIMPAGNLRNLSDDDVQAVVAYLRAQPATGGPTPENRWNVLGAIFMSLFDFRTAQSPVGQVTAPQPGTPEYGHYLVSIIGCADCHGDQLQGKVDNGQPGPPAGPNLTQIVPGWTEAQFMTFFNTGRRPDGSAVPDETLNDGTQRPRMPWDEVRGATSDADLHDLYSYLHSLPPVASPAP